jgi:amino acid adenylation domain-containing protein
MLYRSLLDDHGGGGGYDIEQMHVVVAEDLAPRPLARAWTLIARRHPLLSSSFHCDGSDGSDGSGGAESPRQRVQRDVVVGVETEDWTGLGVEDRARRLAAFLTRDRARGFDLTRAPLMRVTLFPVGPGHAELVWTFHHMLLDGRSMPPVLLEVFEAYAALSRGKTPSLPAPPRPYRDYIDWLATLDQRASLAFFRDLLRGKSTPTGLPLAAPAARPFAGQGYGEAVQPVDGEVRARAHAFVRRTKTTMGTLVQAAWALVLSRTTGQDDVLFGTTRACRRSPLGGDAERMVGVFINSIPVRARVGDEVTVGELLAALRAQGIAARDHEHTPLVEVARVSELPRGEPLFETLVMFENRELNRSLRAADPRWLDRTVTLYEQPSPPLCVSVFDDQELRIRMLFDRRRYPDAVVQRIVDHLVAAISELSRDEHRKLADVDILPPAERTRLLAWNDTARPFERTLIHAPFEERVRTQPEAVAVELGGASLTYAELDARANRLAHALVERGAGPGTYAGICLERGLDLVVALVAVAKSGAAYVPLDPRYPVERLSFMLDDAQAIVVVTEAAHQDLFSRPRLVVDGADATAIARMPGTAPPRSSTPGDVCYAIYTSGSTGKPKGVVLTHEAVVNTFDWVTRTFGVGPGDRLLFVTSPCFDLSVYDTFGALGAGATVVVASRELLADPEALAAAITERGITIWDSAPAALERLVTSFPAGPAANATNATTGAPLRLVMLSGDWIPLSLPGAVRAAFPHARVMSLGGATEAAIWSNWFPIGPLDPRWTSIPYGRPIQNARYHVLDASMRPVPIGVAGDLYIGGACLARGYLQRPELTAERFVADPFSGAPGERLYKTGDRARYFDDGELEFLGRADFQIKIRGFRVELGEVEAALAQIDGVRDAVCVAYPDASGQKSIVGYVVARRGSTLEPDTVRAGVASTLTDFMVPSRIVVLAEMPLSPNGKVDRKALPEPGGRSTGADHVAPSTDTERAMAAVWRDLLRQDQVGVTDDFFALGGHSLLAVMLVSRIERDFGVKLRLSTVLERPTIRALVASLAGAAPDTRHGPHVATLRARGQGAPLFFVSGAGGFGFGFQGVARAVGDRHAVHVLNAIGAEDEAEDRRNGHDRTIEEMASIYLPQVLSAARESGHDGPLVVGGYSFGVLVAFELAHRLRLLGREVPLFVSFDGFAPGFPELMPLPQRLLAHAKELLQGDTKEYVRGRLVNIKGRVLDRLGRAEDRLPPVSVADAAMDRRLRRLEVALWRARSLYKPAHRLAGDLLLLKTERSERWLANRMDDPVYGWRRFVDGSIDVTAIEGAHRTMFGDANQRLMGRAILEAAAKRERSATIRR